MCTSAWGRCKHHAVREFKAEHNLCLLGNGLILGRGGWGEDHETWRQHPHLVGRLTESMLLHKHGLRMDPWMGKRWMAPITLFSSARREEQRHSRAPCSHAYWVKRGRLGWGVGALAGAPIQTQM